MIMEYMRDRLDLEILCTLPCEPGWVAIEDLVVDFDFALKRDCLAMIQVIAATHAVSIVVRNVGSKIGRGCAVSQSSWPKVVRMCESFWLAEHEDTPILIGARGTDALAAPMLSRATAGASRMTPPVVG